MVPRGLARRVPNTVAHVAVAAGALALVGLRGRELALGSLWAAVPDLDVVTAIPWALAAPHLPLDADALFLGAHLFGHRGISHTFLAAALAGAGVYLVRRRWGPALVAGGAWASHILLDAVSPWPVAAFWPLSDVLLNHPLVTGLDPIMTTVSLAALAVLLLPLLAARWDRVPWGVDWLRRLRARHGHRLAVLSLATVALNAAWLGAVATAAGVPFGAVASANVPRTVAITPADDGWRVTERWLPGTEGQTRVVPEVRNRSLSPHAGQALATARCTLPNLGPYATVHGAVWEIRPGEQGLVVEAIDLSRNATGSGGPRLMFTFVDGRLASVQTTGERGEDDWFRIRVPDPVVEVARCR